MKQNKQRAFIGLLVSLVCFFTFIPFGIYVFNGYIEIGDSLVFSWFSPILFIIPIMFVFLIIYHGTCFFYDYDKAFLIGSKLVRPFMFFFIASISFSILFAFCYTSYLGGKGYIRCPGIPSGWMPGMAAKYAKDESFCKKKSHLIYDEE